jgi:hypothetical protein
MCIDGLFDRLLDHGWRSAVAKQPVSRGCIAVRDEVHDVGLSIGNTIPGSERAVHITASW